MAQPSSEYALRAGQKLERELGEQVLSCLKDPEVIEIMLNPDGVLWVERMGRPMARLGSDAPAPGRSRHGHHRRACIRPPSPATIRSSNASCRSTAAASRG